MPVYAYRVFYRWDGPSQTDAFAKEKSPTQVTEALRGFLSEVHHRIDDREATVDHQHVDSSATEVVARIRTIASVEEVGRAVDATLKDWRLYAELLDVS